MKRILNTLKEKWPEYILEILVITVGIFGAFLLNSWNDKVKSRNQQAAFLTNILSNLEEDKVQLDSLVKFAGDVIERTDKLIDSYKKQKLDVDYATSSLGLMAIEKNFNGYRSGMDALVNSGLIELMPTDLRFELELYYEKSEDLNTRQSMSNEYIRDFYEPHIFEYYAEYLVQMDAFSIRQMYLDDTRESKKIDEEKFLNDRLAEVHIIIRNVQTKVEEDLYGKLIEVNQDLQSRIQLLLE